ncbi:C-C motif chemokine 3 [Sarcophilus harrisii]|uniref:Chemokine interleukin-8-like domain-containing protein n=1 Tax=Sarcophilus harrisii TaxID=9305 RepID=A0A7N4V3Y9_SARHA|nr:C-C motif chemokine 3 [Sarcophilus harrisii]
MISLAIFSILIISIPGFCFESERFDRYDIPSACCHSYILRKIPYKIVTGFYETSSFCHKPGVIFFTKKDLQICANPSNEWVQMYMFKLKQKKNIEDDISQMIHLNTSVE